MSVKKTYREAMVDIAESYHAEHGSEPVTSRVMGEWAIAKGLWEAQAEKVLGIFIRDMATALQHQIHEAPNGQEMRTWMSIRISRADESGKETQQFLWIDVREAKASQVRQAFMQRRHAVADDARALYRDQEAYNSNYLPKGEEPIQLSFNFDDELEDDSEGEAVA